MPAEYSFSDENMKRAFDEVVSHSKFWLDAIENSYEEAPFNPIEGQDIVMALSSRVGMFDPKAALCIGSMAVSYLSAMVLKGYPLQREMVAYMIQLAVTGIRGFMVIDNKDDATIIANAIRGVFASMSERLKDSDGNRIRRPGISKADKMLMISCMLTCMSWLSNMEVED